MSNKKIESSQKGITFHSDFPLDCSVWINSIRLKGISKGTCFHKAKFNSQSKLIHLTFNAVHIWYQDVMDILVAETIKQPLCIR